MDNRVKSLLTASAAASSPTDDDRQGIQTVKISRWKAGELLYEEDLIAEEVPVAMVYNGISHVVMMATPTHLEDFALGFSLSEGIVQQPQDILDITIQTQGDGIIIDMEITARQFAALKHQRRNLAGRSGCGICGTESLEHIRRPLEKVVAADPIADEIIAKALSQLDDNQPLRKATGASHGAAWCARDGTIVCTREDVGRHNALDKLLGNMAKSNTDIATGFVLISSRASYEIVQKTASFGIGTLVAVSAPTTLAIEIAKTCGMQLIGFCRPESHINYI